MKRLGLLCLVITACFRDPVTAPADTTIALAATSASVPLGGIVDLVVDVLDPTGKTVKDGTPITLICCTAPGSGAASGGASISGHADSASTSELGTLEPALVHTVNGKASARFRAGGRSGTAYIVARSGGARPGTLQLAIGGASVARLTLTASPSIVSSSNGDVELRANALDEFGNGVSGVRISLAATFGILADHSLVTDSSGGVSTHLTTNRETIVTAVAGAHSVSASIHVSPLPVLSMSAVPRSPVCGEVVQFSIVAAAANDGPQLRDLIIEFGDGTQAVISGLAGTTNVAHSYANPGLYQVTSTVTDVLGERSTSTMIVAVVARPPVTVTLEVSGGQVVTVEVPVVFRAVVSPSSEQSRVVRFEWDFGGESSSTTAGSSSTHVFTSLGTKRISVSAVLTDGTRSSAETTVVVKAPS
jgi:PKD repeat protein